LKAKIKVLIIDDSALVRQVLQSMLAQDPSIEVVGTASDAIIAWRKIQQLQPDVLTLDIEMPRMNGLTFLQQLMAQNPLPVVIISSLTERGCETTLRALELGAIDFLTKPRSDVRGQLPDMASEVIDKIKTAADARVRKVENRGSRTEDREYRLRSSESPGRHPLFSKLQPQFSFNPRSSILDPRPGNGFLPSSSPPLVALGASTGGTEAIRKILAALPPDFPGMVIVQHMPPKFTRAFAQSLDSRGPMRVAEAEDGRPVLVGHVLIAPGDFHMTVFRKGAGFAVRIDQQPPCNRHRPSVDVLFHSCAQAARGHAVGVLLTGMGDDGARGLLAMREVGAQTLAQDETSSVVFGMPRAAIEIGAAERIVSLNQIPEVLKSSVHKSAVVRS
jgi:two-component system chemotaxis response regulator CheB